MQECAICREKKITLLQLNDCSHCFCSFCTFNWFIKKNTCPLCRHPFTLETVRVKMNNDMLIRTRYHKKSIEEEEFMLKFIKYYLKIKINYLYNRQFTCQSFSKILINLLLKNFNMLSSSRNKSMDIVISIIKKFFNNNRHDFFRYLNLNNEYKNKYKVIENMLFQENIIDQSICNTIVTV